MVPLSGLFLIAPDGVHLACWCASFLKFRPSGTEVGPAVLSNTFREGRFDMLGLEFDFLGLEDKHLGVTRRSGRTCLWGGCVSCCQLSALYFVAFYFLSSYPFYIVFYL